MARKKIQNNNAADMLQAAKKPADSSPAASQTVQAESGPSTAQTVIITSAVLILSFLIIGGSIYAYLKYASRNNIKPNQQLPASSVTSSDIANNASTAENISAFDSSLSDLSTLDAGTAAPGSSTTTTTEREVYVPVYVENGNNNPPEEEPSEPEPVKVHAYDFDSKLGAMDANISARYANFDENQMSDAQMGLIAN